MLQLWISISPSSSTIRLYLLTNARVRNRIRESTSMEVQSSEISLISDGSGRWSIQRRTKRSYSIYFTNFSSFHWCFFSLYYTAASFFFCKSANKIFDYFLCVCVCIWVSIHLLTAKIERKYEKIFAKARKKYENFLKISEWKNR